MEQSNQQAQNISYLWKRGGIGIVVLLMFTIGSFFFSKAIGCTFLFLMMAWISFLFFGYIQVTGKYKEYIRLVAFSILANIGLALLALASIPVNYYL